MARWRVPHAGEMSGPATIWEALDGLGAERIGHGISCLADPRLVSRLREAQLPLEVCPTSNVCTGQVPDLAAHPMPRMLAEGLFVTLNSDDPPMFGFSRAPASRAAAATPGRPGLSTAARSGQTEPDFIAGLMSAARLRAVRAVRAGMAAGAVAHRCWPRPQPGRTTRPLAPRPVRPPCVIRG